jgi:hypothetical protein
MYIVLPEAVLMHCEKVVGVLQAKVPGVQGRERGLVTAEGDGVEDGDVVKVVGVVTVVRVVKDTGGGGGKVKGEEDGGGFEGWIVVVGGVDRGRLLVVMVVKV